MLTNTAKNEITEYAGIVKKTERALSEKGADLLEDNIGAMQKDVDRSRELRETIERNLTQADNDLSASYRKFMNTHNLKQPK